VALAVVAAPVGTWACAQQAPVQASNAAKAKDAKTRAEAVVDVGDEGAWRMTSL